MSEYVSCPFCGEGDFDLPGLKWHLSNGCDDHDALQMPISPYERVMQERHDEALRRIAEATKPTTSGET